MEAALDRRDFDAAAYVQRQCLHTGYDELRAQELPSLQGVVSGEDAALKQLVAENLSTFVRCKDAIDAVYETDPALFTGEAVGSLGDILADVRQECEATAEGLVECTAEVAALHRLGEVLRRVAFVARIPGSVRAYTAEGNHSAAWQCLSRAMEFVKAQPRAFRPTGPQGTAPATGDPQDAADAAPTAGHAVDAVKLLTRLRRHNFFGVWLELTATAALDLAVACLTATAAEVVSVSATATAMASGTLRLCLLAATASRRLYGAFLHIVRHEMHAAAAGRSRNLPTVAAAAAAARAATGVESLDAGKAPLEYLLGRCRARVGEFLAAAAAECPRSLWTLPPSLLARDAVRERVALCSLTPGAHEADADTLALLCPPRAAPAEAAEALRRLSTPGPSTADAGTLLAEARAMTLAAGRCGVAFVEAMAALWRHMAPLVTGGGRTEADWLSVHDDAEDDPLPPTTPLARTVIRPSDERGVQRWAADLGAALVAAFTAAAEHGLRAVLAAQVSIAAAATERYVPWAQQARLDGSVWRTVAHSWRDALGVVSAAASRVQTHVVDAPAIAAAIDGELVAPLAATVGRVVARLGQLQALALAPLPVATAATTPCPAAADAAVPGAVELTELAPRLERSTACTPLALAVTALLCGTADVLAPLPAPTAPGTAATLERAVPAACGAVVRGAVDAFHARAFAAVGATRLTGLPLPYGGVAQHFPAYFPRLADDLAAAQEAVLLQSLADVGAVAGVALRHVEHRAAAAGADVTAFRAATRTVAEVAGTASEGIEEALHGRLAAAAGAAMWRDGFCTPRLDWQACPAPTALRPCVYAAVAATAAAFRRLSPVTGQPGAAASAADAVLSAVCAAYGAGVAALDTEHPAPAFRANATLLLAAEARALLNWAGRAGLPRAKALLEADVAPAVAAAEAAAGVASLVGDAGLGLDKGARLDTTDRMLLGPADRRRRVDYLASSFAAHADSVADTFIASRPAALPRAPQGDAAPLALHASQAASLARRAARAKAAAETQRAKAAAERQAREDADRTAKLEADAAREQAKEQAKEQARADREARGQDPQEPKKDGPRFRRTEGPPKARAAKDTPPPAEPEVAPAAAEPRRDSRPKPIALPQPAAPPAATPTPQPVGGRSDAPARRPRVFKRDGGAEGAAPRAERHDRRAPAPRAAPSAPSAAAAPGGGAPGGGGAAPRRNRFARH